MEWKMFTCVQIDQTSHLRLLFFVLMALWDSFVRIRPRYKKVDIYATIRTYWAEVLKRPTINRNLATFCMFGSVNYFSTLNSSSRVTLGHFSKNVIFDPKKKFFGVLYNLVDFWSEKMFVCILIDPKKSFGATFVH